MHDFTPPPPPRPPWADDLLAEVGRAFVETGATTPGWPDPHPDRHPLEEEYSRVLDPGKYRILGTRLDAWARVLDERDVAAEEREGLRRSLVPTRPGALTLVALTTEVDGAPYGLDLGLPDGAGGAARIDLLPDCGCDACDSGSADLLEVLDGWVLTVARGGVVHAQGPGGSVTRMLDGWQGTGQIDERWLDGARPPPDDVRRWAGRPWL
ncbi:DUF6226 family protein [Nocardioides hankookensis]|uniref:DUF6226 family protein n=1 Tax=Nocardioides hankookensis TaxID=443157 RepID=A0ABW1LHZ8_9ACTN